MKSRKYHHVNESKLYFIDTIESFDRFCPLKTCSSKMTTELKMKLKKKDALRKRMIKKCNECYLRNLLTNKIKKAKKLVIVVKRTMRRTFFRVFNDFQGKTNSNPSVVNVEEFNDFFVSVGEKLPANEQRKAEYDFPDVENFFKLKLQL